MSGPFAPGDVVVCIAYHPGADVELGVRVGGIYKVAALCDLEPCPVCRTEVGVEILGHAHADYACCENEFEVLPKADPAFTEAMRAIKPIRKEVKA